MSSWFTVKLITNSVSTFRWVCGQLSFYSHSIMALYKNCCNCYHYLLWDDMFLYLEMSNCKESNLQGTQVKVQHVSVVHNKLQLSSWQSLLTKYDQLIMKYWCLVIIKDRITKTYFSSEKSIAYVHFAALISQYLRNAQLYLIHVYIIQIDMIQVEHFNMTEIVLLFRPNFRYYRQVALGENKNEV